MLQGVYLLDPSLDSMCDCHLYQRPNQSHEPPFGMRKLGICAPLVIYPTGNLSVYASDFQIVGQGRSSLKAAFTSGDVSRLTGRQWRRAMSQMLGEAFAPEEVMLFFSNRGALAVVLEAVVPRPRNGGFSR